MYVCTALQRKRTNLYVLRSTGNAYDVISHRRLSGPRAPPIFWTSLGLCVAEALTPLLRLGNFSWIVTRDSHKKILNSKPWSRPTKQGSATHQLAAAHRLKTAALRNAK